LFNAASIVPAPSPYGRANTQSAQKTGETENPNIAKAVTATPSATASPAPNFLVNRSDAKLAIIVPPEISMETIPAYEDGTAISPRMTGHAEPSRESGNPRLTNDIYIITINRAAIG
jgi:hypothetical protein